jgi:hypothetical protein
MGDWQLVIIGKELLFQVSVSSKGFMKNLVGLIHYVVVELAEVLELKTGLINGLEWFVEGLLFTDDLLFDVWDVVADVVGLDGDSLLYYGFLGEVLEMLARADG